jgi:hypothetical protein
VIAPKTQAKLFALGAAFFVAFGAGWAVNGWRLNAQIATITGEIASQREAAVTEARTEERRLQAETNDILRGQNENLLAVNATLERDLDGLRNRPPRIVRVPGDPGPECAGRPRPGPAGDDAEVSVGGSPAAVVATGADLAREDSEWLTRFAAKCASTRTGLIRAYEYADSIQRAKP